MVTATKDKGGGRTEQLMALERSLSWEDSGQELSKPLLCFLVPPARFLSMYKSRQEYKKDGGGRPDDQVCDTLEPNNVRLPYSRDEI